jgi:hypothetical protein
VARDFVDIPSPPPSSWRYANYFQVGATENELIIDFALHFEGMDEPCWHTRIILARSAAHELENILRNTLQALQPDLPVQ